VRFVAYAALVSTVPGFFLWGLPELACSSFTAVLAVVVLAIPWRSSP
jgi:hypothetical protein